METRNSFMESTAPRDERLETLKQLYPELVRDGRLNVEALKDLVGDESFDERDVGYSLYWPGKREAKKLARKDAEGTLEPVVGDGKNEDSTNNIYIEGDNLEVLRCLKKSYANRVKMIYIDPPYNTGKDFIYPDNFAEPVDEYLKFTGQVDGSGTSLVSNPKSSGAYHRKWLDMMLPRLQLARELLTNDGVIFISIDDNEQANLKLLCDEVFGEENFCGTVVVETATDNNPSQVSKQHEYMLCYGKNITVLKAWERTSEAAQNIQKQYLLLKGKDLETAEIEFELKKWIKKNKDLLPQVDHYNKVDEKGVYSSSGNSSNPHPGGYTYDIIHPVTGLAVPKPANGWRWKEETFLTYAKNDEVEWGVDHTTQPHVKKRLITAVEQLRSIIYEDNRGNTSALSDLFDGKKIFDNPKSTGILEKLVDFVTEKNDIVMDFFSGSASTAQAVLELNRNFPENRKFIMVQLPIEIPINTRNGTEKAALSFLDSIKKPHTICEIGKERIRRAGAKILEEHPELEGKLDVGFKVYRLAKSNIKSYKSTSGSDAESLDLFVKSMESQITPLRDGFDFKNENDIKGLLTEIILRQGFALDSKIETLTTLANNTVYRIVDPERPIVLNVCLDDSISATTVESIEFAEKDKFVCLNSAISDELYAQLSDKGRVETI